jgi:hypothetical protein
MLVLSGLMVIFLSLPLPVYPAIAQSSFSKLHAKPEQAARFYSCLKTRSQSLFSEVAKYG